MISLRLQILNTMQESCPEGQPRSTRSQFRVELFTEIVGYSNMADIVPKSYRLEGQPRSTRNEYPIRSAFGNSRQIQYGDLLAFFSLRSNLSRGQSTRRRRERSMFTIYQFEILLYERLQLLLSSIHSITLRLIYVKLIAYTNYNL